MAFNIYRLKNCGLHFVKLVVYEAMLLVVFATPKIFKDSVSCSVASIKMKPT